jgi:prepilin-type N-terminal cleavage/methylation domain-containing protein
MTTYKNAFTLIELLVVIIIIAIIIALAIPKFLTGAEATRVAEAKRILGSIRESEVAYQSVTNSYTNSFNDLGLSDSLGLTQTSLQQATTKYWTINIHCTAPFATFTAEAVRNTATGYGALSGNICINPSGTVDGNHPYANSVS